MMIYVETVIQAPLARVWELTRDPAQHQRWDLRFSRIEPYGPAGQFRYATQVLPGLPGLTMSGTGVTAGERQRADGSATSVLRFASAHPLSLVRDGSGFWRYLPTPVGVRFLTGYDYSPGWGRLGRVADLAFRPLFGWATAWSFDRLRLWLERGIPPVRSRNQAVAEAAVRLVAATALTAATVWAASVPALLTLAPALGLAAALALLLPPLPGTPAARRCRRRYRGSPAAVARWATTGGAARAARP